MYQSRRGLSREERDSTNQGCSIEVWHGNEIHQQAEPALVARGDQRVEVVEACRTPAATPM